MTFNTQSYPTVIYSPAMEMSIMIKTQIAEAFMLPYKVLSGAL